jgi:hypothetical protein
MALATAKTKLGPFGSFEDLPADRGAAVWDRVEQACGLTLAEVSALQNARCGG